MRPCGLFWVSLSSRLRRADGPRKGKLVEQGTHEDLMERQRVYYYVSRLHSACKPELCVVRRRELCHVHTAA